MTYQIEQELDECYRKIKELKNERDELMDMVAFLEENRTVQTFHNGKYTDNVREVYMKLLNLNIGRKNIKDTICIVLKNLANLDVDRLPSESLTSRLFIEAKCLAEIQTANMMIENSNCTLHYDETSKFGDRYGSLQVTTPTGSYICGMFDMDCGTGERLFEYLKDCITELATFLDSGSNSEKDLAKLVFSFVNTMTDRHITNTIVDELLVKWRLELAPQIYDSFDELSATAKEKITHINSFKCNLHFLIGLATEANKALIEFEEVACKEMKKSFNILPSQSESGAVRTIRTVCKTFQKHGSEEAGVMANFAVFLKDMKCHLASFRGNRFNIVFWNGAATYFHRNHFHEFFELHGTPNKLLRAVQEDLNNLCNIAGVRALGIIDKLITGPFWRLIEDESKGGILDLNQYFQHMQLKFKEWAEDATPLLYDHLHVCLFPDIEIHKDDLYNSLFADSGSSTLDTLTVEALEVIFNHFNLVVQRQLRDHLQEGKFDKPSPSLIEESQYVPKTNQIGESVFGTLDRLIRERPNATTLNLSSSIQYVHNKTGEWLNELPHDEKEKYMQKARQKVNTTIDEYKKRKHLVKERIQARMNLKHQEKLKDQQKQADERRKIIAALTKHGGEWTTVAMMDEFMNDEKNENKKRDALLAQLKYHKKVLKTPVEDKTILNQQKNGQVYTTNELMENLKKVIQQIEIYDSQTANGLAQVAEDNISTNNAVVSEEQRKHELEKIKTELRKKLNALYTSQAKKDESASKKNEAGQNKRKNTGTENNQGQKRRKLSKIKPEFLVGKRVEHSFTDDCDSTVTETYIGTITKLLKRGPPGSGKKVWSQTMYEIVYDTAENPDVSDGESDDEDELQTVFKYPLLEDYYDGSLKIIDDDTD